VGAADKEANRQARGFDSLSISLLLLLLFSTCYHHPLSLESHHHILFVNCLVVVVLLAFPLLSVLKQASSPYHSKASSVVSTLVIFS
jgi:hypothetical protein